MTNPPALSLNDLMYAYFKAGYNGTSNEPGSVTIGSGIKTVSAGGSSNVTIANPVDGNGNLKVAVQGSVVDAQVANRYQSVANTGVQTAPTAGLAIASIATFDYYYDVSVIVGFGGTAETAAVDNFQLKAGATVIATIPVSNVANQLSQAYKLRVNPGGAVNLTVNAIAAGSAGSIYKATVVATRLV